MLLLNYVSLTLSQTGCFTSDHCLCILGRKKGNSKGRENMPVESAPFFLEVPIHTPLTSRWLEFRRMASLVRKVA